MGVRSQKVLPGPLGPLGRGTAGLTLQEGAPTPSSLPSGAENRHVTLELV